MAESLSEGDNLSREYRKNRPIDTSKVNLYRPNPNAPLYDECFTPNATQDGRLSIGDHQELIFTIGLPASGKSTWAREYCETRRDYVRINRDDLRNMRGIYWLPKQEDMITDWEVDATALALINGYSAILDATNLNEKRRLEFVQNVKDYIDHRGGYSTLQFIVNTKKFDTPVEECIKRDNMRKEGHVGKKVILQMANKYGLKTKYPEYRFQAGLPQAIICDLDGTLASNDTGRGFYDWHRVGEDGVDDMVNRILDVHRQNEDTIIIMSGRDGICSFYR